MNMVFALTCRNLATSAIVTGKNESTHRGSSSQYRTYSASTDGLEDHLMPEPSIP